MIVWRDLTPPALTTSLHSRPAISSDGITESGAITPLQESLDTVFGHCKTLFLLSALEHRGGLLSFRTARRGDLDVVNQPFVVQPLHCAVAIDLFVSQGDANAIEYIGRQSATCSSQS
jgi:hypothetical protein